MNRSSRVFRPAINGLESRALLSVTAMRSPIRAEVEIARLTPLRRQVPVSGTLRGSYLTTPNDPRIADAPLPVQVSGTGNLRPLGRFAMTGTLNFGGFLPPDVPSIRGTVTLRGPRGSLTVDLSGTGGNGPVAGSRFVLNASVVRGTGAYANVRGIGTADALFGENTVRCITTPCPAGGSLTLRLNLKPPIR